MDPAVRREEEGGPKLPQDPGEGGGGSGLEVGQEDRPRRRAVADPGLAAVHAVVGGEEEPAVDFGELPGAAAGEPGNDVLDEDRAGLGAVALPELPAVDAVFGGEEDRAPHGG